MGFGDQFLVKPGTLLLILLIAAVGLGIYNWASTSFATTGNKSLEKQDNALKCANFDIEVVDIDDKNSSVKILFSPNKDTSKVFVRFKGAGNKTKVVTDLEQNELGSAEAEINDFSNVRLKADDCPQTFP